MKLSTRIQYGLRMLCQLAVEYNEGPVQMSEIGLREGISEKYLGQIMLVLRSSGLVLSVRGSHGGYYLCRPPHSIRVLEVFEILEGELLGIEAEQPDGRPAQSRDMLAATTEIWSRLRAAMRDTLATCSLADLVAIQLQKQGSNEYSI
jgi:Rrf2 family transcriptional regulator, cysteine metabolism repressor